jgi:uncharacterized membrane protein
MKTHSMALPGFGLLLGPLHALAQQGQASTSQPPPAWWGTGPWPMGSMWHTGWSFWWVFPLVMFLMMVACAILVVRAMRSGAGPMHCGWGHAGERSSNAASDHSASALQILNERFARGEIARSEYEEKWAALAGRPSDQRG